MDRFCVYMVDYHQISELLTRYISLCKLQHVYTFYKYTVENAYMVLLVFSSKVAHKTAQNFLYANLKVLVFILSW